MSKMSNPNNNSITNPTQFHCFHIGCWRLQPPQKPFNCDCIIKILYIPRNNV